MTVEAKSYPTVNTLTTAAPRHVVVVAVTPEQPVSRGRYRQAITVTNTNKIALKVT